jgi:protein SCO1
MAVMRRRNRWAAIGAVVAMGLALAACGGSSAPGPPSANLGAMINKPVPSRVDNLPLTDAQGRSVSLGALHGQIVVLADFMTLCQETCPLTTGNFLVMDQAVKKAGMANRVRFVELTVDPRRDTPSRLAAYGKLVGAPANWSLLTGRPAVVNAIWRYFGIWYQKVPEGKPAGVDWLTGRPLTYDVDHEDALIYLDASGRERFVVAGSPNATNSPIAPALRKFLSAQGRTDLAHPNASTWTAREALTPIAWLSGKAIQFGSGSTNG